LIKADDVFDAVGFQRLRLKEDQQIPEWAGVTGGDSGDGGRGTMEVKKGLSLGRPL
jgi:hypothetical protein